MSELFGTKYFDFIAGAYGITAFVLMVMLVWVLLIQRQRKRDLAALKAAGIRRANKNG